VVLFESRDALRAFLGDHLNTIRDVVDTSGNIVNHLTIDSFGRRTAETNGNIEVMIGLSGRPYDEDTVKNQEQQETKRTKVPTFGAPCFVAIVLLCEIPLPEAASLRH
jgi:hypothetical protein